MDGIAVAARVVEAFQRQDRAALGRQQAIGVAMEGSRPAARAECAERGKTPLQEQRIGTLHGAGKRQIGVTVDELIAGQLDRVQRA
ncbi:MAG TPA: hypothetical protein VN259_03860, partial [Xanthomonadales bacterium]|nr:hypothetical protein [Xanthomonadales bacterium]